MIPDEHPAQVRADNEDAKLRHDISRDGRTKKCPAPAQEGPPARVVDAMALIMREHENIGGCRSADHLRTPWAQLPEGEQRRHRSWAHRALALLGPIDPTTFKLAVKKLVQAAEVEDRSDTATLARIHEHLDTALASHTHRPNKAGRRQRHNTIRGNARREIIQARNLIRDRMADFAQVEPSPRKP